MKSPVSKYQGWRRRVIFIHAFVLLLIIELCLRLFRFRPFYDFLLRMTPTPNSNEDDPVVLFDARDLARIVQAAANRSMHDASCLRRSLALWWILRRRGINSEIIIGVISSGPDFASHAWVVIGDAVINDSPDVAEKYGVIDWQKNLNLRV